MLDEAATVPNTRGVLLLLLLLLFDNFLEGTEPSGPASSR